MASAFLQVLIYGLVNVPCPLQDLFSWVNLQTGLEYGWEFDAAS